ncbi:MAG: 4a-hydroxytetrahydrobiopterin dehydratase [Pseudomonadota bacterium]|nr:4a-hydroxytetrahydrobiopterin dehydratase [Pseudomonadota bacterium]
MRGLSAKKCVPCEGGVPPLTATKAKLLRTQLHKDWRLAKDSKSLRRSMKFKDFYRTMSFVNAVAHIANSEDHHPDLELGYDYCHITYATHSIGGLSENDFICAAKIDRL